MKIKSVNIKYFKFHQDFTLNLDSKNCLIYGENGSGKSSIYDALYSNFYYQKRKDKLIDIAEFYKHRSFITKDLEVNILFDNNKTFNRTANNIEDISNLTLVMNTGKILIDRVKNPTIYFANEKVLNRITKENFYIALQDTLFEHFPELRYHKDYQDFNNIERLKLKAIEDIEKEENKPQNTIEHLTLKVRNKIEDKLKTVNMLFKSSFENSIPIDNINHIIKDYFQENFKIRFEITKEARFETAEELMFLFPEITIVIDDIRCSGKLNNHFNEAKLKLISVAIYFACAKKYEAKNKEGLKLLVLDDFLTSLDMANRKLIIQYILEAFKDYQKVILTHNLQFFNLIIKMINLEGTSDSWNLHKLFIFDNQSFLYNKSTNYLPEATSLLQSGDLQSAGNYIRKEFERLITEFEQLLELGKVEDLQNIIDALSSSDKYYVTPRKCLMSAITNICTTVNSNDESDIKINKIKSSLKKIEMSTIDFNEKITDDTGAPTIHSCKTIIKKGEFYKNFILNSASHDDQNTEIYQKECQNAIQLLKYLDLIIKNLKGTKYD